MTLQELVMKEMVWNKEKIQVECDGELSRIDRIEFLMYDYEDHIVDWFESEIDMYDGKEISIIIFHVSMPE